MWLKDRPVLLMPVPPVSLVSLRIATVYCRCNECDCWCVALWRCLSPNSTHVLSVIIMKLGNVRVARTERLVCKVQGVGGCAKRSIWHVCNVWKHSWNCRQCAILFARIGQTIMCNTVSVAFLSTTLQQQGADDGRNMIQEGTTCHFFATIEGNVVAPCARNVLSTSV